MPNPNLQNLKIFSDWLLCEPIKEERKVGGLVEPVSFEEKTSFAKVVMLGNEIKKPIKVGDVVFFNQYASISFTFGEKTYLILKEEDILGSYVE